jgi:mannosyltransferase OCH1-like enzyme
MINLVLFVILLFVFRSAHSGVTEHMAPHYSSKQHKIPRIIWTFWDKPSNIPKTVQQCIKSWKLHNPNFEIILLTKDNLRRYLPDIDVFKLKFADNPQRVADFVRICVLCKHGGFWSDASILMNKPLDWLAYRDKEFVGYYIEGSTTDKRFPVVENWFFGCVPHGKFVELWKKEFLSMNSHASVRDYVRHIKSRFDIQNITPPTYLTMHLAAQAVIQSQPQILNSMVLLKAEDGPFKYLHDNGWNKHKSLSSLCDPKTKKQPIVKFRGIERNAIENDYDRYSCVF